MSACFAARFSGSLAAPSAGSSFSQTRFITPCMLRVPLVIAMTVSWSGSTMQNWPCAPSPRNDLLRERQNW